jgi:hypothetical protein
MKFHGTQGLRKGELRDILDRGGRFIHFQYAFSILIMTFRRSSSIHLIRPGEGTSFKSLKYSLFTLLYGWWGFPWGPIYSIQSLFQNLSGGLDVTPEIRKAVESLDDAQAAAMPAANPLAGYFGILLPLLLVSWFVFGEEKHDAARAAVPGYPAFRRADDSIASYHGKTGFGNSVKAAAGAIRFAAAVKAFRDLAIGGKDEGHVSMSQGHFLTYVHKSRDSVGLLVHVPRLRKNDEDAKQLIEDMIWQAALPMAREQLDSSGGMLLVGVRGMSSYDKVWEMRLADTVRTELDPDAQAARFYAYFD